MYGNVASPAAGCHVGEDLIRENDLQQYNASEDFGLLYISRSHSIQCSGRVRTVEACMYAQLSTAEMENDTKTSISMGVYLLRFDNVTSFYQQVGSRVAITVQISNSTIHTYCFENSVRISSGWIAQPGDIFGVNTDSVCSRDNHNNTVCPAQCVVTPTLTNSTAGTVLLYSLSNTRRATNIPPHVLTNSSAIVNIRATVGELTYLAMLHMYSCYCTHNNYA